MWPRKPNARRSRCAAGGSASRCPAGRCGRSAWCGKYCEKNGSGTTNGKCGAIKPTHSAKGRSAPRFARRRRYASAAATAASSASISGVRPGPVGGVAASLAPGLRFLSIRARRYAGGGPHHPGPGLARLRYALLPGEDRVLQFAVQVTRQLLLEAMPVIVADQVHLARQGHIVALSA